MSGVGECFQAVLESQEGGGGGEALAGTPQVLQCSHSRCPTVVMGKECCSAHNTNTGQGSVSRALSRDMWC